MNYQAWRMPIERPVDTEQYAQLCQDEQLARLRQASPEVCVEEE